MVYINKEMQKASVTSLHFSPLADRKKQNHFKPVENFTSSIVDPVFNSWQQPQGAPELRVATILGALRQTGGVIAPDLAEVIANEETILRQSAQELTDHLDGRITSFFRQMIDCYATEFAYELGIVEDQLESSKSIEWKTENQQRNGQLHFQSAHNGTIPCLIAYPSVPYAVWEARGKTGVKPEGHVHQKYSDTYRLSNACEGLLKVINDVDSDFDWKKKVKYDDERDRTFREFALSILNASAKSAIDPFSGMRLFIGTLRWNLEQLFATQTDSRKKIIYQIYMNHLANLSDQIQNNPHHFFDLLLGVRIDTDDPRIKKLETIIYPTRFKTLQTAGAYQSQIAAHINAASTEILKTGKKPNLFDQAFKAQIIKRAHERSMEIGKIFSRYYCVSKSTADELWQDAYKPAQALMNTEAALSRLDTLIAEVEKLTHNLSIDVSLLRGNLLRQLRAVHRMSQAEVAERGNTINAITQLYSERLYQQKISNLELGGKKITDSLAQLFSRVFNTHPSVFIEDL